MQKSLMPFWSAISGATAVSILALAAHFLPKYLEIVLVSAVTTAATIQLFHAILCIYLFNTFFNKRKLFNSSKLIFFGSLIFAISIYILALNSIIMLPALKFFGPVTPIGGVLMITGWMLLALNFYKSYKNEFY